MTTRKTNIFSAGILCLILSPATAATAQPPPPPAAEITVTDSVSPVDDLQISFGDITEGNWSDNTVTIKNDGNVELIIGSISSADRLTDEFLILNDNCSGQSLIPSDECTFRVRFSPAAAGTFNDTFDIPSNDTDENPVIVSVNGRGLSSASNNPPSVFQLLFPADNQEGVGTTVEFRWKKSADPDGDTVTYDIYVCEDGNLTTGCITGADIAFLRNDGIYYAGIGSYGAGMLLSGIVLILRGGVRDRKKILMPAAMIAIAVTLLISCGGGGGGDGSGGAVTPSNGGGSSNQVSYTVSGLNTGTSYYWKAVAKDGNGGETDSSLWSFDTQ